MTDEITDPPVNGSRLRVALASIAVGIVVVAILATAITIAANDNGSDLDETSLDATPSRIEVTATPSPMPSATERQSFFDKDPLEGIDCMREPLIMDTRDTSVGRLMNKDQLALITCAQ
jgi:hypothetical protein